MTVAVLLAAGGSTRLGRPKQSLPWGITTLLGNVLHQLQEARCEDIVVVLGGAAEEVEAECQSLSNPKLLKTHLTIVHNEDWQSGQASSLRCGLKSVRQRFDAERPVLLTLCDQPLIPITHYAALVKAIEDPEVVAAATEYPEGPGVPACVRGSAIEALMQQLDDQGAKQWLRTLPAEQIKVIECPEAGFDIDTAAQYANAQHARRRAFGEN